MISEKFKVSEEYKVKVFGQGRKKLFFIFIFEIFEKILKVLKSST